MSSVTSGTRSWTSPASPGRSAGPRALVGCSRSFVLISSSSVYADHSTPDADEDAELLPALDGDFMESMETYGGVEGERRVRMGEPGVGIEPTTSSLQERCSAN